MNLIKNIKRTLKNISKRIFKYFARRIGNKIVYHMARLGYGTNECMEIGCLPVLTHFYQPIPDIRDLEKRDVWNNVSKLSGVSWNPQKYMENLKELSKFANECEWPNEATGREMDFHINNGNFSYGCASVLHSIIRRNKPAKIIEIGSGNSSRIIIAALQKNVVEDNNYNPEYIIIDPYSPLDISNFPSFTKLLKEQVETIDISIFQNLSKNDILFIDSSHVCKIGSDVNFEILEILPILNRGVYVHFHDIGLPYEYPKVYATNPDFRVFWTEAYLLQAFLAFNNEYEIILPLCYIQTNFENDFRTLFKKGNDAVLWASGSFWIKSIRENK
ncbi:MAG: class I SAM-dependent methyltransferase [Treponema sp.]|jgi:hypothetical protein|nr:class I SAM-dependent methyltransferase [Treponema sp.]